METAIWGLGFRVWGMRKNMEATRFLGFYWSYEKDRFRPLLLKYIKVSERRAYILEYPTDPGI